MSDSQKPGRPRRGRTAARPDRSPGWSTIREPPPRSEVTPATIAGGVFELVLSGLGVFFLWRDYGTVDEPQAIGAWILAASGGLVAGYTWVVGARHRLWGPSVEPWAAVVFDVALLGLAVVSVGLIGSVHPAFGMMALQALLASVFIRSVQRSAAPQGCVTVLAVGYGLLLLFLAVFLYRELQDDATRTFGLGMAAMLSLAMPGVRTLLLGVPRQPLGG